MVKANNKNGENPADERKLYLQELKTQISKWEEEVNKLRESELPSNVDAQLKLIEELEKIKGKIEEGKKKIEELEMTDESLWETLKEGVKAYLELLRITIEEHKYIYNRNPK